MRIASWNVCFQNSDFDQAFRFLASLEADLICLQEVPEHLLDVLKTLPYQNAIGIDVDRIFPQGIERNYLVILSKYPIEKEGSVSFTLPRLPIRTRLFARMMRRKGWSRIDSRTGLWADIDAGGRHLRVFCLHLLLAHPGIRAEELERALKEQHGGQTIVCGDFNILEYPSATILNWILGGPFLDAFRFTRERRDMEQRFDSAGLKNPLRGSSTHNYSKRLQLSHILVPKGAEVKEMRVFPEYHGSDHKPVAVEIA